MFFYVITVKSGRGVRFCRLWTCCFTGCSLPSCRKWKRCSFPAHLSSADRGHLHPERLQGTSLLLLKLLDSTACTRGPGCHHPFNFLLSPHLCVFSQGRTRSAECSPELRTVGPLNTSWLCTPAAAAGSGLAYKNHPFLLVPFCRPSSVVEVTPMCTWSCVAQEVPVPRASPAWCWRRGHRGSALARKRGR